mgnify:CR=1 FL=1
MSAKHYADTLSRHQWHLFGKINIYEIMTTLEQHPQEGADFFLDDVEVNIGADGVITIYDDSDPGDASFWRQFDNPADLNEWLEGIQGGRCVVEPFDFLTATILDEKR